MNKIDIIESLYGKTKYESMKTQEFEGVQYIAWYIVGYETIEDLRKDFKSDIDIINLYNIEAS